MSGVFINLILYRNGLTWSHELDIQEFVRELVRDVIRLYGFDLILSREVSIKAIRPDFWVLKSARGSTPLGNNILAM